MHIRSVQPPLELQSTLPHGERHSRPCSCPWQQCFNPRSRTGSDAPEPCRFPTQMSFKPRSRTGSDCDHFSPLPCNDMQGIFREGHEPRIKFALSKTTQKIYYNKIILLKNRVPPRKMLCASGSRGLSTRSTHISSSATLVSADTLSLPLRIIFVFYRISVP